MSRVTMPLALAVDDDQFLHLGARVHLHRAQADLALHSA